MPVLEEKRSPVAIRLPEQMLERIDEVAKANGLARSEAIQALLSEALERLAMDGPDAKVLRLVPPPQE